MTHIKPHTLKAACQELLLQEKKKKQKIEEEEKLLEVYCAFWLAKKATPPNLPHHEI